ncbi:MAG: hypothetical protein KKC68_02460 [Candidatus Thermoplasmatota archaeon]|nr:hypothetical protein [Candidatus Thermoplasmatota archaeon]MBU1940614.1 hypothetical protein [Candidatus Thermoplasmatota archaeon]
MKRKTIVLVACLLTVVVGIAGNSLAGGSGPAPNSGDGIPDGSGFDSSNGPNGVGCSGNGHDGPAPNSGDGIPDGPGW